MGFKKKLLLFYRCCLLQMAYWATLLMFVANSQAQSFVEHTNEKPTTLQLQRFGEILPLQFRLQLAAGYDAAYALSAASPQGQGFAFQIAPTVGVTSYCALMLELWYGTLLTSSFLSPPLRWYGGIGVLFYPIEQLQLGLSVGIPGFYGTSPQFTDSDGQLTSGSDRSTGFGLQLQTAYFFALGHFWGMGPSLAVRFSWLESSLTTSTSQVQASWQHVSFLANWVLVWR